MKLNRWVRFCREAGAVRRFHTERMLDRDTVARHSFHVTLLCLYLEPEASGNLLRAALFHDLPERETGDTPAPTKWANGDLKRALDVAESAVKHSYALHVDLTDEERMVLKWADYLDAALTCLDELQMGNRTLGPPFSRLIVAMRSLPHHDVGVGLLEELTAEYAS